MPCLDFHSQFLGGGDEAVDDDVRVLRLRKDALVILYHQGHTVLLEPLIGMVIVETLEEALHQLVSAGVGLLQVGNFVEGVGEIAPSSSGDFHLGEHLLLFLEDGDVGVWQLALGGNGGEESCRATTDDSDM